MFTSNSQFTFNLQCSFESESVNMIVIVWINSSHFQDTQSGYNINDITFQEGFNFHCLFRRSFGSFCNSLFSDNYAAFPQWTVNASRDTFSVVVPTYFKVYESKKFLSSILKPYARRLARIFSCGKLIAECHSINNFYRFDQKWLVSKTQFWRQSVC